MAVSKDTEKGTWTSQIWVEDWQGKKKHKKKRGFASKKEALEWERNTLLASKTDMNMKLTDFVEVYFRDKDGELKQRTIRNKRYMIEHHIIPLLGNKSMDGITPADIIQWQNEIRSKGFKETYQRMLQNQMTALFTHATKIYNLKDNPCTKVKRMGRADADKKQLQFWTLDEFNCFISTFEDGSKYHVLFDLLFYSGCRIGEALALTASDIDTVNKRISITKTYFRHKGKDEITEPKTRESVRMVIILEFLAEELKEYMASMYKLPADERIFAVVPEAVQHVMKRHADKAGVKYIRVHDLRHSSCACMEDENQRRTWEYLQGVTRKEGSYGKILSNAFVENIDGRMQAGTDKAVNNSLLPPMQDTDVLEKMLDRVLEKRSHEMFQELQKALTEQISSFREYASNLHSGKENTAENADASGMGQMQEAELSEDMMAFAFAMGE